MKTEILEKRVLNSKTFRDGDKFILEAHTGHIHYLDKDTGKLEDINTDVVENGQGWEMRKAGYEVELPQTSNGAVKFFANKFNRDIYSGVQKERKWQNAKHIGQDNIDFALIKIAGQPIKEVQGIKTDHHQITYPDVIDGVDLVLSCGFNSFRKEIVIKKKLDFEGDYLEIEFATNKRYFRWQKIGGILKKVPFKTIGKRIRKGDLHFRPARVWDNNIESQDIEIEFGWNKFIKRIPREFLEKAVYPVKTDTTESYYSGAGEDGQVYNGVENLTTSWYIAHEATTGEAADGDLLICQVGGRGSGYYYIRRDFLPFDTSALPDDAVISAATLGLYITSADEYDNDAEAYIGIVQTSQNSPTALIADDYDQCGAVDNPTQGATAVDITDLTVDQYNTWTLNATGRGWISKTGYTLLGMREGHDITDTPTIDAGGANDVRARTSEYAGTASDPYLEVTYTVPPPYVPRSGVVNFQDPAII